MCVCLSVSVCVCVCATAMRAVVLFCDGPAWGADIAAVLSNEEYNLKQKKKKKKKKKGEPKGKGT